MARLFGFYWRGWLPYRLIVLLAYWLLGSLLGITLYFEVIVSTFHMILQHFSCILAYLTIFCHTLITSVFSFAHLWGGVAESQLPIPKLTSDFCVSDDCRVCICVDSVDSTLCDFCFCRRGIEWQDLQFCGFHTFGRHDADENAKQMLSLMIYGSGRANFISGDAPTRFCLLMPAKHISVYYQRQTPQATISRCLVLNSILNCRCVLVFTLACMKPPGATALCFILIDSLRVPNS